MWNLAFLQNFLDDKKMEMIWEVIINMFHNTSLMSVEHTIRGDILTLGYSLK